MRTVGIGLASGVSAEEVLSAILAVLPGAVPPEGVAPDDGFPVRLATLDTRAGEPGLVAASRRLGWPVTALPAAALARVPVPAPSAAVAARVGTPSVAEAAALAGGGALLVGKTVVGRVTVAVAAGPEPASTRSAPRAEP